MKFELRPAMERAYSCNEEVSRPTGIPEDFFVYADDQMYGTLWKATVPDGYVLELNLPDHDVEYSAIIPTKDAAIAQIEKIVPLLVGNPYRPSKMNLHSNDAAGSALSWAMYIAIDEGAERAMEFLRIWQGTDRTEIRNEWPEIPEDDDLFGTEEVFLERIVLSR